MVEEFTIPVPELKKAVKGLSYLTDMMFKFVQISKEANGIRLALNGIDTAASYSVPDGTGNGSAFVKIEDLIDILKCVRGDTVSIKVDGTKVVLRYVEDLWKATFNSECEKEPVFGTEPEWPKKWHDFPDFFSLFLPLPWSFLSRRGIHPSRPKESPPATPPS